MATLVLIHGGGGVGWHRHLLQEQLRMRGYASVAPDLRCDDDAATLIDYAKRRLVPERLGIVPDEIPGGHCVALSRPAAG